MSVIIKPFVQGEIYNVNGIYVRKQGDDWKFSIEPSQKEIKAFGVYLDKIINNKNIKRHPKATYKG
jgi:hypothetical protein